MSRVDELCCICNICNGCISCNRGIIPNIAIILTLRYTCGANTAKYLSRDCETYFCSARMERVNGDIQHSQRVVAALGETIELMEQIDVAIEEHGGWPIE